MGLIPGGIHNQELNTIWNSGMKKLKGQEIGYSDTKSLNKSQLTIGDNDSFFAESSHENGLKSAFYELLRGRILESSVNSSDILAE